MVFIYVDYKLNTEMKSKHSILLKRFRSGRKTLRSFGKRKNVKNKDI